MQVIYGAAALLACCMASGCGGEDGDSEQPIGRGSEACRDFQDATCDFASDRCRALDRAMCDATFRGIECVSDQQASACANALNEAACGSATPACDFNAVVDRAPAIAACETVMQAFCEHNAMCGAPAGDCAQSAAAMGVDCNQAVSVDLRYETCLDALDALTCGSPAPAVCMQIVYVLPAGL